MKTIAVLGNNSVVEKWYELNLLAKFSLASAMILVALGLILNFTIAAYVEQRMFANFAAVAVPTQNRLITPNLQESAFSRSESLGTPAFTRFMREQVFSKDLVLVKIWRRDGTVMWSNESKVIGQKFRPKAELREALRGHIGFEETDLSDVENIAERPDYDRLLEIYSPIRLNGEILGAYEAYYSIDGVLAQLAEVQRATALAITAVFALLFFALFGLVRSAQLTIEAQTLQQTSLTNQLSKSLDDLRINYLGTLVSLSRAIDARDKITGDHSERLSILAHKLAFDLDLPIESHKKIEYGGRLHDIGKIGVPEHVLQKPGKLTPEEMAEMQKHPVIGGRIIASVPFLAEAANVVRHHHERVDGTGYPDGLKNGDIPIEARILTVVDSFDAMTSDRPYRAGLSSEEAIKELVRCRGTQFDPEIVDLFLKQLKKEAKTKLPPKDNEVDEAA